MRIAIIAPFSRGPMRGNITTVRRISHALAELGNETLILPVDDMAVADMEARLSAFAPDVLHAFHAGYCGELACVLAGKYDVPCVVTITGSDINDPQDGECLTIRRAMAMSSAIACFDELVAAQVSLDFTQISEKIVVVPQGVIPPQVTSTTCFALPEDAFVVLLPAALRPVKNIEFALRALIPLSSDLSNLMLVIAGGVIDQKYADSILGLLATAPFAVWLDEVPYDQMGTLYTRADLVLNCSHFEGMPNSLLEAMALARPVLAVDIPGNHSLVHDGETGWLYGNEAEFKALITQLYHDETLRTEMGRRARDYVLSNFPTQLEAERYIELYTALRNNPQ